MHENRNEHNTGTKTIKKIGKVTYPPSGIYPHFFSALFPLLQLPNLPQSLQQQIVIYNHLMLTIRANQAG